ncbi:hypothetical protein [Nitrosopumilus sp. S4]
MDTIQCEHVPKIYRRLYRCTSTGNYCLELCSKCAENESPEFLIKEELLEEDLKN